MHKKLQGLLDRATGKRGNILSLGIDSHSDFFNAVQRGIDPLEDTEINYAYVVDPENAEVPEDTTLLDPYSISDLFLRDLVAFMPEHVASKKQQKALEIAKALVAQDANNMPEVREVKAGLSKPAKKLLDDILDATEGTQLVLPDSPAFNIFARNLDPRCESPELLQEKARALGPNAQYHVLRDLVIGELLQTLQQNEGGEASRDFSMVWQRFHPEMYDLRNRGLAEGLEGRDWIDLRNIEGIRLKPMYGVTIREDLDLLKKAKRAAKAAAACHGLPRGCASDDAIEDYNKDCGTVNPITTDGENPLFYSRLYVTGDPNNETTSLYVDTVEGVATYHADSVRATNLAFIQFLLDTGMDSLVAARSIGKYGRKQGFGNHETRYTLSKVGEPVSKNFPGYYFDEGDTIRTVCSTFFRNWQRHMGDNAS